jgi:transmembrane sensor
MDHKKLTVEDLASNESFIDWVKQSDPEAVKYWDLYIVAHPDIREKVDRARALVLNLKAAEDTGDNSAQVNSMWASIQGRIDASAEPLPRRPASKMVWAMALASILLVLAAIGFWVQLPQTSDQNPFAYNQQGDDFVEEVNNTDEPLEVRLEDGSTVVLESKSKLKYKKGFSKDSLRQVYMLGKAFFRVTKNPYKPFIVHSNEIVVKVLGTSFQVESPENGEKVLVSVKTGKVSVSAPTHVVQNSTKRDGVILLPNQQVTYERKNHQFEKTLIESPEFLSSTEIAPSDFAFDNVPIAEAFKTIESAYGVEIIFNEEVMKNCYITASLGSESLRDKLKIICATVEASYEIIDANVVINSAGCPSHQSTKNESPMK